MQKTNKKLNEKSVGATSSCPHFEGITLRNQKGITLIALIITIIVMLILVGVTINVALNGGLFETAETAADLTTVEAEKEALSMAAIAAYDIKTGVDFTSMALPEEFTGSNGTYTSNKSGKTYTVDKTTAKVTEVEVDDNLAYLKAELEGKLIEELISGFDENGNPILKNTNIECVDMIEGFYSVEDDLGYIRINYNEKMYIASYNNSTILIVEEYIPFETSVIDDFNVTIKGTDIIIMGLTEEGKTNLITTKKIIIPSNITGIGKNAFENLTDLEIVEFASGSQVKTIGGRAFRNCTSLTTINLPDGLVTIWEWGFYGCTSIKEITIPLSVDNLGNDVFSHWTSEQTIYMKGRTESPATGDGYAGVGWGIAWNYNCNANIVWDE